MNDLTEFLATTPGHIEGVEKWMLENVEPADCPLTHSFAPGVYLREIFMPRGILVIGHEHRTCHHNIVTQGRALVMMNGVLHRIEAPCHFISAAGVRKILYIIEDVRWITIHPSEETDLQKLEEMLIVKSASFLHYHSDIQALRQAIENHDTPREIPALS